MSESVTRSPIELFWTAKNTKSQSLDSSIDFLHDFTLFVIDFFVNNFINENFSPIRVNELVSTFPLACLLS